MLTNIATDIKRFRFVFTVAKLLNLQPKNSNRFWWNVYILSFIGTIVIRRKWKYALDGQILAEGDWLVLVKVIVFTGYHWILLVFEDSSSLAIQFGILETRRKDHFSQLLRQIKFNTEYEWYRNLIKYFIKWHFTASKMQRIGQKWPNCIF